MEVFLAIEMDFLTEADSLPDEYAQYLSRRSMRLFRYPIKGKKLEI
jgi:hypothetical protein